MNHFAFLLSQYVRWALPAAKVIKEIDPQAKIVLCASMSVSCRLYSFRFEKGNGRIRGCRFLAPVFVLKE